jgi:hypothetical protein
VVTVVQAGLNGWARGTRVPEESIKGEQRDPWNRVWQVPVPANGKVDLDVTYLTDF